MAQNDLHIQVRLQIHAQTQLILHFQEQPAGRSSGQPDAPLPTKEGKEVCLRLSPASAFTSLLCTILLLSPLGLSRIPTLSTGPHTCALRSSPLVGQAVLLSTIAKFHTVTSPFRLTFSISQLWGSFAEMLSAQYLTHLSITQ